MRLTVAGSHLPDHVRKPKTALGRSIISLNQKLTQMYLHVPFHRLAVSQVSLLIKSWFMLCVR